MEMNQAEKRGIKVELRERRMEKHLTQTELAKRLRMSQSYLGQIERGEVLPTVDLANRIAKALVCTTFDIWKEQSPSE